jgi:Domain of unknown function (DUF5063)
MTDPIDIFQTLARAFCSFADGAPSANDARIAQMLLARLYAAALELPVGIGEEVQGEPMSLDAWQVVYERFESLPVRRYSAPYQPLADGDSAAVADVAEDLADIYRDLRRGLAQYERGAHAAAAWEWWLHFHAHWGRNALAALSALHAWRSQQAFA